jgi:hypothetical protein
VSAQVANRKTNHCDSQKPATIPTPMTTNTQTVPWRTILKEAIHTLQKAIHESNTQKKVLACEAQNRTYLKKNVHLKKTLEVNTGLSAQPEISPSQERRPTSPQALRSSSLGYKSVEHALREITIEYDDLSDDEGTIRQCRV